MAGFAKKKYFKLAKGFYGRSKNCLRITIPRVQKSLQKSYIGRKLRPRNLHRAWIQNINTAARDLDINYSQLACGLTRSNMILNRKILSDLSMNEPFSFKSVIDEIKIQNQIITKQRHYKLEQMIKRNLLTNATIPESQWENSQKEDKRVKVQYVEEGYQYPDPFRNIQ